MNTFPTYTDEYGELTITETYLYYDMPRLFEAVDLDGTHHLVSCLHDSPSQSIWMLTPVSEQTRIMLTLGSELREALLTPTTGLIAILVLEHRPDMTYGRTFQMTPSLIPDKWLPEPGLPLHGEKPGT